MVLPLLSSHATAGKWLGHLLGGDAARGAVGQWKVEATGMGGRNKALGAQMGYRARRGPRHGDPQVHKQRPAMARGEVL